MGYIHCFKKKHIIIDVKAVRIHGPLITLNRDIQNFVQQREQLTSEAST